CCCLQPFSLQSGLEEWCCCCWYSLVAFVVVVTMVADHSATETDSVGSVDSVDSGRQHLRVAHHTCTCNESDILASGVPVEDTGGKVQADRLCSGECWHQ